MKSIDKTLIIGMLCLLGFFPALSQQIIEAEYFIDFDPGVGNGIEIPMAPGEAVDINFTADFSGLETGFHTINMRLMDENGVWTHSTTRALYAEQAPATSQLVRAEYFIDADPGTGNGIDIPITSGNQVDVNFTADLSGTEPGFHTISTRVMDENGTWTIDGVRTLYVEPEAKTGQILAAEYFFDTDPGSGNGIPLPINSSDTLDIAMDIPVPPNMEFGDHHIYFRTQSTDSLWSHYTRHFFNVCTQYGPLAGYGFALSADRWVAFTDQSQNAASYLWDFDDGTGDTAMNPVHQFALPGIYKVRQMAINDCKIDTMEHDIVIRGIFSVQTNKGGNTGSVMLNVNGFGFTDDAELSFTRDGFSPIIPDTFNVQNSETIGARFDLQNKEAGYWNVSIELPGDTVFVLTDGFEIKEGGAPDLQITVNGRSRILINRRYDYQVTITNNGYEDAVGIPFVIRNIPETAHIETNMIDKLDMWTDPFYGNLITYIQANDLDSGFVDYSITDQADTTSGAAFLIPFVPAGSSLNFTIGIFISELGRIKPEFLTAPQGYLKSSALLLNNPIVEPINCRTSEFRSAFEMVLDTVFDQSEWDNCFDMANSISLEYLRDIGMGNEAGNQLIPYQGFNGAILNELYSCLLPGPMDTTIFINAMALLNKRFNTLDLIFENTGDCDALSYNNLNSYADWKVAISPQKNLGNSNLSAQVFNPSNMNMDGLMGGFKFCYGCKTWDDIDGVGSLDPNEKSGPGNNPYDNYLNEALNLSYSIHFENIATATAAAGRVKIVDTLDAGSYDLASFEFGAFGFNTSVFTASQEGYSLLGIYDLRPERPVYLKMEAFIDTVTGYTEFVFESLDTLTLQLTDDPDAGFLLPNVNHPEGEGFVSFTVNLKNDLASGNEISNQAEIYFDNNEPIITNIWTNIYDNDLPESQVIALPDTIFSETFTVEWEGFDATSGIEYSDIYASTIDGADTTITLWQHYTGETSGEFTGTFGEKYYFLSLATDSAGNIENAAPWFDTEVFLYNPCWDSVLVSQAYEICFGDSILIEGNWQFESGIYYDTLSTIYGCDSIIESQLTVFDLPEQPVITWDGTSLISTPAEAYQWYVGETLIEGATSQQYIPAESGIYFVEVSNENDCIAKSEGYDLIISIVVESDWAKKIKIYPNPTDGMIFFTNLTNEPIHIEVYTSMGELIIRTILYENQTQLDMGNLTKGLYYLKIISEQHTEERKIIVN